MGKFLALTFSKSDLFVPVSQFGILCNNAYVYAACAKGFRPAERMIDQRFPETVFPLIGKHGKALKITYLRIRQLESNASRNTAFAFNDKVDDTSPHVPLDPVRRTI